MGGGGERGPHDLGFVNPPGGSMLSKDQEPKNVAGLTGKYPNSAGALPSGRGGSRGLAGLP